MLGLERLGNLTSELSTSLVKSLVLPRGLWRGKVGGRPGDGASRRPETGAVEYPVQGPVFLVGGTPVPDDVAVALIHTAGGRAMRVAILNLGADGCHLGDDVARVLRAYGVHRISSLQLLERSQAEDGSLLAELRLAPVWVLAGSNPRAVCGLLAGTVYDAALRQHLQGGGALVAIGGAAAALGEKLVVPFGGAPEVFPGLQLLPKLVIAAETSGHGQGQLLREVGAQLGHQHLGVGVDPAGALLVHGHEARVLGPGSVTFLDGRDCSQQPDEVLGRRAGVPAPMDDQPPVCGLRVHVLVTGYALNLKTRRPMGPAQTDADRTVTRVAGG